MKISKNITAVVKSSTFAVVFSLLLTGCNKYLDIPLPVNAVAGSAAYISDNTTSAVVNGNFNGLLNGIQSGSLVMGVSGVGYLSGLYADELFTPVNDVASKPYFSNALSSTAGNTHWVGLYKQIYNVNVTIEGINGASNLKNKNQWLGESLFLRAFLYFNLVNLYGDAPLTTTSDFNKNNLLGKSPKADIYKQIITDLKAARALLIIPYKDGLGNVTADRGRPNVQAVNALLARTYLYTGDWANAEAMSATVIADANYQLVSPAQAFLANSQETIWALVPSQGAHVNDYDAYNGGMPATLASPAALTPFGSSKAAIMPDLLSAFETGDTRLTNWIRSTTVTGTSTVPTATYYYPNKYKSNVAGAEYTIVLRLAEQYLIRAEARAQLQNLNGAKSDVDAVRARAGLGGVTAATKDDMLASIAKERRTELFTEAGHRFFDLKRTGTLDAVMTALQTQKNMIWQPFRALWPIPLTDIQNDPNLAQNPGYN